MSDDEVTAGGSGQSGLRAQAAVVIGGLVLANLAAWLLLWLAGSQWPAIWGPGALAYTFGLRHAVDADHIAAIDNVTRKLLLEGQASVTVGLWFSLGHVSVVTLMCVGLATASTLVQSSLGSANRVGGLIGTGISASVLLAIGIANLVAARQLQRQWAELPRGEEGQQLVPSHEGEEGGAGHSHMAELDDDGQLQGVAGGCLVQCCARCLGLVDRPWKMWQSLAV